MTAVHFQAERDDDKRRKGLYSGDLFVYRCTPGTQALCALARTLCEEAFHPHSPPDAQHHMPLEDYVAILAELKPKFIHHPDAKQIIQQILREYGCDLRKTYFDVPRLRTVTSDGYLTSGLGYAFKPHRDTWYSAPPAQINWWFPVYEMEAASGMAFHPRYWTEPVENDSHAFDYRDWVSGGRKNAAQHVKSDTRKQSAALKEIDRTGDIVLVTEPGGLILFSAAQLHATMSNTTGRARISIDFRTVHLDDLENRTGAPNIDSASRGTTIGDYLRATDLSHIPPGVARIYEEAESAEAWKAK